MTLKILNLYAGIGGNRKLWVGDIEVTAVEIDPQIANIYFYYFPNDKVIVGDAHQYLLEHYTEFDFIWTSPPCQSHSRQRKMGVEIGQNKPKFPSMQLYEEIIFLQHYFKGKFIVENVIAYYEPLIKPKKIQRHWIWSNYPITEIELEGDNIKDGTIEIWQEKLGFDITQFELDNRKDQILRNCVHPKMGLHLFNMAFKEKQNTLLG